MISTCGSEICGDNTLLHYNDLAVHSVMTRLSFLSFVIDRNHLNSGDFAGKAMFYCVYFIAL